MGIISDVKWLVRKWDTIPDKYKHNINPDKYSKNVEGVKNEGHIVVLLMDRQKPSVESYYDFDEERIGVNRFGQVIWGFDSGCSCPVPWENGSKCYDMSKTWKEFVVNLESFDNGVIEDCLETLNEIKKDIEGD